MADVAAERGARLEASSVLEELRGLKMSECVEHIERRTGVSLGEDYVPQVRLRMADAFRSSLRAMAGAHELLRSLTVPFCVASSGPREKIELSLSLTGLSSVVNGRIFSSYEIGSWKPEPGIFLHAAAALRVAPAACAVVEDSEPGIRAGLAAGMHVLAYGERAGDLARRWGVRHVPTHDELSEVLRDLTRPNEHPV